MNLAVGCLRNIDCHKANDGKPEDSEKSRVRVSATKYRIMTVPINFLWGLWGQISVASLSKEHLLKVSSIMCSGVNL